MQNAEIGLTELGLRFASNRIYIISLGTGYVIFLGIGDNIPRDRI